jgi:hypothetical protein
MSATEKDLVSATWGFEYSQRWLQQAQLLAFVAVFLAVTLFAAKRVRHVQ